MKRLTLLALLFSSATFGQNTMNVTQAEYHQLKNAGALNPQIRYIFTDANLPANVHYGAGVLKNDVCNCMVPLDSTFVLAMGPNDDLSSDPVALPFSFDFYGNSYDTVIINNNGNISFVAPYYTFTPNAFPDSAFNMIAPFWGDVDTRSGNGGQVWYKTTPNALVVIWNEVGYFSMHEDLLNTFQLIITDGTDSLVPSGSNVSFCYEDMQWTTGDASGGVGGVGGSAATVGVNIGDGVNYFQVGQYDTTGTAFDGPYGNNDGVDFLDGQEIYFNVSGAANSNTPPVLISSAICDTIDVYTGDTLQKSLTTTGITFAVTTPESNQTVTTVITCSAPDAFTYTETTVTPEFKVYDCEFDADGMAPGIYTVQVVATDNGTPVGVTSQTFIFKVNYEEGLSVIEESVQSFRIYPNPASGKAVIELTKALPDATVSITDFSGKLLLTTPAGQTTTVSTETLTRGAYIVTVNSNGSVIGKEILIIE